MRIGFLRWALLGGVALTSATVPAFAQTAPATVEGDQTDEPDAPAQSGDIIVTAQRRDESLAKTPVAVSVLSADTLAKQNITTESDLTVAAPGLAVRAGQNSSQINYAIRGQSLDAYSSTRPGVQPYIDEIQIAGAGVSSGFFDLQSVQVLKGPQGTLFGRNSTGGAVLFTTQKPTNEFGGYASLLGGNYNQFKGEGAINVPIVADTVLARVAGFYQTKDGYQYNLFNNRRLGGFDRYGIRGSLTIKPTSTITNDLVVDYQRTKGTSLSATLGSVDPTLPGSFPTSLLYNPPGAVSDFVLSQILQGGGVPPATADALAAGNFARFIANFPGIAGLDDFFAQQQARGPYVIDVNSGSQLLNKNLLISNITSLDIGPDTQIRNIFGYVSLLSRSNTEADGTPFALADQGPDANATIDITYQVQEELQLVGTTGALKYVTGLYFSDEKYHHLQFSQFFDIIFAPTGQENDSSRYNRTYAGYAQGTYDLSNIVGIRGLGVTVGLRYTSEKVSTATDPNDSIRLALGPTPPPGYAYARSTTYNNVSWTLGVQEQVNPNLLIYVASRHSYKNGGYNGQLPPFIGFGDTIPPGNAYRTEILTDAELGLKYQGILGSVPTRFNLAIYNDWIKNSQRTSFTAVLGNPTAITINVPKAQVFGVEVDGQVTPVPWLTLGAAVNYTNGRFTDNTTLVAGNLQTFETYPDTPKFAGNVFADVTIPVGGSIDLTLHGDGYSQGRVFYTSHGNFNTFAQTPGYTLANFRVGLQDDTAGWSLTANLKNAFNKVYFVGGLAVAELLQFNTILPGEPRVFSLEARFKF